MDEQKKLVQICRGLEAFENITKFIRLHKKLEETEHFFFSQHSSEDLKKIYHYHR